MITVTFRDGSAPVCFKQAGVRTYRSDDWVMVRWNGGCERFPAKAVLEVTEGAALPAITEYPPGAVEIDPPPDTTPPARKRARKAK